MLLLTPWIPGHQLTQAVSQTTPDEHFDNRFDRHEEGANLGLKIVGVLLAIVLGIAGFLWINGKAASARTVWLVNGTTEPYTIELDGQPQEVPYGEPVSIRLPEGTHSVRILPPHLDGKEATSETEKEVALARTAFFEKHVPAGQERTFTIDSSLGLAVLDSQTHVINPDGAAILRISDVVYGNKIAGPSEIQPLRFHHILEDIDDVFVDSPNSVEGSSFSSGSYRSRVDPWLYEERLMIPGVAGEPLSESDQRSQILARFGMSFDSFFWQQAAAGLLDDVDLELHSLTRPTAAATSSDIPSAPEIHIPASPVVSALRPGAGHDPEPAPDEPAVDIWAGLDDELFTIAITQDISSSNGGAQVGPLKAAIKPLAEERGSKAAGQIMMLLHGQVSPTPARLEQLETLGTPPRVRLGLMLVLKRGQRKAGAKRLLDAARELADGYEDLPEAWASALETP